MTHPPTELRRYVPARGALLAIHPDAIGAHFGMGDMHEEPFTISESGDAVVTIRGPLEHHESGWMWCDSYEAIERRVGLALQSAAPSVILDIDSPGGAVSGCFEMCRRIRGLATAAGKRLIARVNEQATSAAYALACACDEIQVPATGEVGSVGVIAVIPDYSGAAAEFGVKFNVITSGARKADGCPLIPMSDDARAALQERIDGLAQEFFSLVTELRPDAKDVASLEAAVYYGSRAIEIGLADTLIQGFDDMKKTAQAAKAEDMPKEDEEKAEGDEKKPEAEDAPKEEEKAEDPPPPSEEEAKPADASAATIAAMAAKINELSKRAAAADAREAAQARAEFFASRPDLSADLVATLKDVPLDQVKAIVAKIPRGVQPPAEARATGTRGATQGDPTAGPTYLSDRADELDAKMGLIKTESRVVNQGSRLVFGAPVVTGKKVK